jgi:hypothetical protein
MIELRYLLDPEHPEKYKDDAPLDTYSLQYRIKEMFKDGWEWSEWKDVPFVA